MPFRFTRLNIPDIVLVEPTGFADERGFFMETFKQSEFKQAGLDFAPVQENHSSSKKGVLRGLHYQSYPFAQAKLVRVVHGSIFDASVDLRKESPSFKKWVGVKLSGENKKSVFVPKGFAHGYVTLEDDTEVAYLVDAEYSKPDEMGIIWNDSTIDIRWPTRKPLLSSRDANWPSLIEASLAAGD